MNCSEKKFLITIDSGEFFQVISLISYLIKTVLEAELSLIQWLAPILMNEFSFTDVAVSNKLVLLKIVHFILKQYFGQQNSTLFSFPER